MRKKKSPGLAAFLGFLFGGFGVMYVSFAQGLMALGVTFLVSVFTAGIGLIPMWFACAIWGHVAAQSYNEEIDKAEALQNEGFVANSSQINALQNNPRNSGAQTYQQPSLVAPPSIAPPSIAPPLIAPPSASFYERSPNTTHSFSAPPSSQGVSVGFLPPQQRTSSLYCHNCGAELRPQAKFCSGCGSAM